ncbi:MAG: serine/threonine-protein kinase [Gemmatimonadaceae bacterium]
MNTPTPPNTPRDTPLVDRLRASTAGRYSIHAELGAGGMATVFRATEIALEREVAIKVMSAEVASSPGAFERFRREARVAAALSHPNIVPIYAIGEDPALPFFAMKFIEGRGLDAILRKQGAQSIAEVARIISAVGKALFYAHERGVVHRDVKPANIMLGDDGWPYVTDFGIAKRDDAQQLTQAGTVIGTPAYMSPEQFNGQAITGAADQYSLGIVAFEMLTGRAPFDGPSLGEVMRGHLLDPVPPIRTLRLDVPLGVAECVNRMLAKEPEQRFASLAEAATALEAAAAIAKPTGGRPSMAPGVVASAPVGAAAISGATVTSGPTTPIPRSNPSLVTSGAKPRPITATQQQSVQQTSTGSSLLIVFVVLAALGGTAWYLLRDEFADDIPSQIAAATPAVPVATTPEPVVTDSSRVADSSGTVTGDSTEQKVSLDSALAAFAARVAAAPVVDIEAPEDSSVVRVGSQVLETVLFVNGRQLGIVGGRGLVATTVAPGPVSVSIRRVNCRDWDTTFTASAGRRYSIGERSPGC